MQARVIAMVLIQKSTKEVLQEILLKLEHLKDAQGSIEEAIEIVEDALEEERYWE